MLHDAHYEIVQVSICNYEVYDYDPINKVPRPSSAWTFNFFFPNKKSTSYHIKELDLFIRLYDVI